MITCHIKYLNYICNQRGYTLDEVKDCIVSQNKEIITVDETHPAYPRKAKTTRGGVGTELKNLLNKIGIKASPSCSCNKKAAIMDTNGIQWCENNIDTIVGWLREEANKRKLPFIDTAGKILVKRAISNAKKNQQ